MGSKTPRLELAPEFTDMWSRSKPSPWPGQSLANPNRLEPNLADANNISVGVSTCAWDITICFHKPMRLLRLCVTQCYYNSSRTIVLRPQSLANSGKPLNFSNGIGHMMKISLKINESLRFKDSTVQDLVSDFRGYRGLVATHST